MSPLETLTIGLVARPVKPCLTPRQASVAMLTTAPCMIALLASMLNRGRSLLPAIFVMSTVAMSGSPWGRAPVPRTVPVPTTIVRRSPQATYKAAFAIAGSRIAPDDVHDTPFSDPPTPGGLHHRPSRFPDGRLTSVIGGRFEDIGTASVVQ